MKFNLLSFLLGLKSATSQFFGLGPYVPETPAIVHVDSSTGQIYDEWGRSRIFHGVNIVYKAHPYYPNLDTFDPRLSFSKEDVDYLADLGMNAIRLDVSWAGAEPMKGSYNQTFFEQIHKIVKMCKKRGIYVLLEFHQDLFSERYCGNGAPLWASRPLNPHSKFGYPFPAWKPFKIVEGSFIANQSDCDTFSSFALGYFNWHLSQAFQDLYSNHDGLLNSFVAYWQKVVGEFKGVDNILGYELMNEPWVGQFYKNPRTVWGPFADWKRLQPLYDILEKGIRAVDTEKLIFFESINTDLGKVGFTKVPGGPKASNKSVLAWHYYFNPIGKQAYVRSRFSEARRLSAASFATEFDISWDGTLRANLTKDEGGIQIPDALETMRLLDEFRTSWLGWEYKTYVRKTGWGDGLFDEKTGLMRPKIAALYSRPYATAVTGIIHAMSFSDDSGYFYLSWTVPANSTGKHPTEVTLNKKWHYPRGYRVEIMPSFCNSYKIKGNTLLISTRTKEFSQFVELIVKPR